MLAAELGLPFAFAAHFAPEMLLHATRLYRTLFRRSAALQQPWLMVAVPVIAAETDALARRLFTTPQQRFLRLIRNQAVQLLPPVDSMDSLWSDVERAAVEGRLREAVVGSDSTVKGVTKGRHFCNAALLAACFSPPILRINSPDVDGFGDAAYA